MLSAIGFSALLIHLVHSRQRRRFFLAASPGSIGHIISLAAHARFAERLYPYDDDDEILRKLASLRFSLDPRTGAIVADSDVGLVAAPVELEKLGRGSTSSGTIVAGRYSDHSGSFSALGGGSTREGWLSEPELQHTAHLLPYHGDLPYPGDLPSSYPADLEYEARRRMAPEYMSAPGTGWRAV